MRERLLRRERPGLCRLTLLRERDRLCFGVGDRLRFLAGERDRERFLDFLSFLRCFFFFLEALPAGELLSEY